MTEPGGRSVVERFARALQNKDFDELEALLTDDFTEEMPQSGERVRGKANQLAIVRNYPGGVSARLLGAEDRWVMTPSFTSLRIEGSGDVYTYVGTARYPNGETWQMISIIELRQGRVAKTTTWYAAPFEAPEWRAPYVERFSAPGA